MEALYSGAGLVILLIAGDFLVRGAVGLSLRLGVPALIVSLTVVSFGTSAPELLIAVESALEGAPGIALGNVLGSNIANVLLVLGLPAMIATIDPSLIDTRVSFLMMIAATLVFILLAFLGPFTAWHGVVLVVLLAVVVARTIHMARAARADSRAASALAGEIEEAGHAPLWRSGALLLAGLVGLPLGADILVEGARSLAAEFGVPDEVIGITLVAIGTSLPELATTVMAAIRQQADVALGNVIGSNLLNILAIMGVASFFGPLPVPAGFYRLDLWVMLAAALALAPFVLRGWKLGRPAGIAFIAAYAAYMVAIL